MYKIAWADYYEQYPVCGIVEKEGSLYYFDTLKTPTFISSVDGEEMEKPKDKIFNVYMISQDNIQKLTEEHDNRCSKTGEPTRHGDPMTIYLEPKNYMFKKTNNVVVERLVDQITEEKISNFIVENKVVFN